MNLRTCASGYSLSITLSIFLSSSIRLAFTCSLPAVSTISTSVFLAFAEAIASYTTAEGSAPSVCFTIFTLALSAQVVSWSLAAALKVSPAATMTDFPSFCNFLASLPIVVVLPTPFTPTIIITVGGVISTGSASVRRSTSSVLRRSIT